MFLRGGTSGDNGGQNGGQNKAVSFFFMIVVLLFLNLGCESLYRGLLYGKPEAASTPAEPIARRRCV